MAKRTTLHLHHIVQQLAARLPAVRADVRLTAADRAAVGYVHDLLVAASGWLQAAPGGFAQRQYLHDLNDVASEILPELLGENEHPHRSWKLRAMLCQALRVADIIRGVA